MTTVNWIQILKLKEFQNYFNAHELQQLSMVSNKFRASLIKAIFKTFNFRKFILYREYYSYFNNKAEYDDLVLITQSVNPYKPLTSDFISSKNTFKLDLKEFLSYPSQLIISNCYDYSYLLFDVAKPFSNLTNVTISHSQLQFELFQHLLDSLNYLENVELLNTKFIQYTQNSIQTPFNWPNTLKKLKFCYNELGYAFNKEAPIRVSIHGTYKIPMNDLILSPQKLPNLESFEYSMLGNLTNNDSVFNFLILNQQIKQLKIDIDDFDRSLFNSIKLLGNLNHLGLNVIEFGPNEPQVAKLPVLNTVSHLSTSFYYILENRDSIFNMFPNLDSLTVKFDEYTDENVLILISIFPNIKCLSLNIHYIHTKPNELTLPKLNNLLRIEFNLFCNIELNISNIKWNTETCPNLKLVKFTKLDDDIPFKEPQLNLRMENDWKIAN
ncbi:hypothetical protein CONCODRAFT_86810 [Conidiobolus coronatus NRRL 28638]|uniref:F-box domain-containing protein n=1 Tax=Conidiobolus coronatus (strain ATCC 28846 / CBS 209.66 / NRRL 28638) TaxID=796925 RepID=A0A137NYN5_CONC2|nr:hypothetical protein CONCODRAFT_86810 [Conidiobolus coronatus NRRL 28638]|eukprot:KXN67719.1 hypothetical protein CONCODRAFT_86810 [Conidiobolus coronatus NRRL 28638]